jgi:hypothetical protein
LSIFFVVLPLLLYSMYILVGLCLRCINFGKRLTAAEAKCFARNQLFVTDRIQALCLLIADSAEVIFRRCLATARRASECGGH